MIMNILVVTLARVAGRTLAGSGQSRGPGYFRSGWLPIRIRRRSPRGQRHRCHPFRISGWCLRPARPKPTSMSWRMRRKLRMRPSALWLNLDPPPLDHHPTPHLTPHCKPWPTLLTTGHRTSSMTFDTKGTQWEMLESARAFVPPSRNSRSLWHKIC